MALEIVKVEAELAKARQATSTGGHDPQLMALMPQAEEAGTARDKAAELVGVSARYVQDAKAVEAYSPERH